MFTDGAKAMVAKSTNIRMNKDTSSDCILHCHALGVGGEGEEKLHSVSFKKQ